MRQSLQRLVRALPFLIPALLLLPFVALALAIADLVPVRRPKNVDVRRPDTRAASLVIPNWNGRDLLERFLPSWIRAIENHPGSEIVIVDNGSDDGSAEWVASHYPDVRVVALPKNLGFGGGSNVGFREARNDIVVLLNSDMRVAWNFLDPLLAGFTDDKVFAVSCQIFLRDKTKRREETGLTQGWWQDGGLRVSHREDPAVDRLFPCFYGGGGSCAFDRRKFLELGGFDELLAPFYLEDTDLGYMAWKRGWKVLYEPGSVVHHEHRGTIGRKFSDEYIQGVLQKNFLLFVWKNIHSWPRLAAHFLFAGLGAAVSATAGERLTRASARGILKGFGQLPGAIRSRRRARQLALISDAEAFRRTEPAFFHDRFSGFEAPPLRPRVLFVSPYSIYPPTHGGGVFMYNTLRELSHWCDVHAIVMLDYEKERAGNDHLLAYCQSLETIVRTCDRDAHLGSITPHAIHEFHTPSLEWLIQRQTLLHRIDVIQLEYTALGQYARRFQNVACALFEHDVYFQSIGRALPFMRSPVDRLKARFEYLRAMRYELKLLPRFDHVQVCTRDNKKYLDGFLPRVAPRIEAGLRAGVETGQYTYPGGPREAYTMLFVGSFRHIPNQVALNWFAQSVLPMIVAEIPEARLIVAGSDPPPPHALPAGPIQSLGFVEDIQPLFSSCALFVCPIRNGSGVRVKLLEAFASGIPVVSTYLGAEGLASEDGEFAALSDDPAGFAHRAIELLRDQKAAAELARRARREVEANWDMKVITSRLVGRYWQILTSKRSSGASDTCPAALRHNQAGITNS